MLTLMGALHHKNKKTDTVSHPLPSVIAQTLKFNDATCACEPLSLGRYHNYITKKMQKVQNFTVTFPLHNVLVVCVSKSLFTVGQVYHGQPPTLSGNEFKGPDAPFLNEIR